MSAIEQISDTLRATPKTWLVTGAAGFIGSNLTEHLLQLNQSVIGLDNFSTGHQRNLDEVKRLVPEEQWSQFHFIEGDIRDFNTCERACSGIDYVLHQAALGSVPRSITDPGTTNASNVTGFLNMITAARDAGVKKFVYASSSAVYGDHPDLPKKEEFTGNSLSPYAVSKAVNELYADVFGRCYGSNSVGLRYFNVFGPRQDPEGPYAAVIPKWIASMIRDEPVHVFGDGETTRDFCYISNVVQANILAATANHNANHQVFNIALNDRTSLNDLYANLRERLLPDFPHLSHAEPVYDDFRPGDIQHSDADIRAAREQLGYEPKYTVARGLEMALAWYVQDASRGEPVAVGATMLAAPIH